MKPKQLTPKQARFCEEFLIDLNATKAAIRAGYSKKTAAVIGWQQLQKTLVQKRIGELGSKRSERLQVDADYVVRRLLDLAESDVRKIFDKNNLLLDPKDMSDRTAAAIASIEVIESEKSGITKKIKFWSKPQALEMLGRHLKLFTEVIEHRSLANLEERMRKARARARPRK